ncbi:Helicase-associated domain [Dillenia turbinata]|uniref:RNA helicase n=1 Tax=Dillenia turbinata TaxID=194707 RepID=A0AAN8Z0F8_9MAGN
MTPTIMCQLFRHLGIQKQMQSSEKGRADRCQPGICYHLYSEFRASSMPDFQVPEIKRTSIEELCLKVKLLDPHCKIAAFLQKTLDPPVSETIQNAVIVLQDIGALSPDETFIEADLRLGSLPVHPLTSRMLLFAILLKCLDPALTLACASDYRDPFTLPMSPSEKKSGISQVGACFTPLIAGEVPRKEVNFQSFVPNPSSLQAPFTCFQACVSSFTTGINP